MPGGVGPSEREKTADGVGEAPPCGSNGLRGTGENGVERGSRGAARCGLRFKEARREEGAPTTRVVAAVAAAPGAGGCRAAR
jgi:hypothetical protein